MDKNCCPDAGDCQYAEAVRDYRDEEVRRLRTERKYLVGLTLASIVLSLLATILTVIRLLR